MGAIWREWWKVDDGFGVVRLGDGESGAVQSKRKENEGGAEDVHRDGFGGFNRAGYLALTQTPFNALAKKKTPIVGNEKIQEKRKGQAANEQQRNAKQHHLDYFFLKHMKSRNIKI